DTTIHAPARASLKDRLSIQPSQPVFCFFFDKNTTPLQPPGRSYPDGKRRIERGMTKLLPHSQEK
ncbi:hypothetical protein, partial [Rugamonas violacea]|uniref:hypothetical protein n=1 Tax=Rugamonas sp. CCM 8940 TaxID=2765359 RepID=UPI001F21AE6F